MSETTPEQAQEAIRAWETDENAQNYDFGFTPEQARKVLEQAQKQQKRQEEIAEFQEKLNALCAEYKVTLEVQQNIGIVPNAS